MARHWTPVRPHLTTHTLVSATLVLLALCLPGRPALAAEPAPQTLAGLVTRVETAWRTRSLDDYLALWAPATQEAVADERADVLEYFASETCSIQLGKVVPVPEDPNAVWLHAHAFCVKGPSGYLLLSRFRLLSSPGGWHVGARETLGDVERFVHLELAPQGFRAEGRVLRLEDFELTMHSGTLFLPPDSIGPTALVFVGSGTVRFKPKPDAEREQLRQFCGRRELVARVKSVCVRLNPADLHELIGAAALEPDPGSAARYGAARTAFERQGTDVYRLETSLPGSPWWTFPLPGKAAVMFNAHGTTLAFNVTAQPESLSLFDRKRRTFICMYPAAAGTMRYYEDEANGFDILHHDLNVRLDPARASFDGQDRVLLRLRSSAANLYLRLAGGLTVSSVTSNRWGEHLFFRSASRNLLVVALGGQTQAGDELTLTVRYSGVLEPAQADEEPSVSASSALESQLERDIRSGAPKVYTNAPIWYPQTLFTDYATSRLVIDVPADNEIVSGGQRVSARVENRRLIVEYRQDAPMRYISFVVGRLVEAGRRVEGDVTLTGYGMPSTRGGVPSLIEQAGRIMAFFETRFGPCPYPTLSIVFTEGVTPGGHSPPGMTILSRRSLHLKRLSGDDPGDFSDFPDFFLAHELAHQWWGHGVAPANYRERWLSEAQAHYAAALWIQQTYGAKEFRDVLERMTYWALRDDDKGPINLGQRIGHVQRDARIYRAVIYDKGAMVLHMLRGVLGDDAFFEGLRGFQKYYRFRTATTDDLREEWERASKRDLAAYIQEWIGGTAVPVLAWADRTAPAVPGWRTTVKISAENLPGPVPVAISAQLTSSEVSKQEVLAKAGGTFELDTPGPPVRLQLNADRGLLARVKKVR